PGTWRSWIITDGWRYIVSIRVEEIEKMDFSDVANLRAGRSACWQPRSEQRMQRFCEENAALALLLI
ncbi:MAG: hypothetical protein M0P06_07480, partial [Acidithiobacillus sp.]|nr:hypothetical protein [Acidithiobacillus sp.]